MTREPRQLLPRLGVPDPHNRIQAPRRDGPSIRAHCDARQPSVGRSILAHNEIIHLEVEDARARLDIPNPGRLVAGTRDEVPTVGGEVERVDLLAVALEKMPDPTLGDIPDLQQGRTRGRQLAVHFFFFSFFFYFGLACEEINGKTYPDLTVLGARGKVLAVWGKAKRADVEVAWVRGAVVLEDAAGRVSGYVVSSSLQETSLPFPHTLPPNTHQILFPVCESNTCTVLLQPVAKKCPSFENLTQQTTLSWTSVWTKLTSRTFLAVGDQATSQSLPSFLSSRDVASGSMSLTTVICCSRCWIVSCCC